MDQDVAQWIEKLIEKKMWLFHELRSCFEKEQEALINVEMDALWQISSKKDALCREICKVKEEIASTAAPFCPEGPFDLHQLFAVLPRTCMAAFSNSVQQLSVLKKEIAVLRQHNMVFMNESLQIIDDIMAIISGGGGKNGSAAYNRRCGFNNQQKSFRFLRQEA